MDIIRVGLRERRRVTHAIDLGYDVLFVWGNPSGMNSSRTVDQMSQELVFPRQ